LLILLGVAILNYIDFAFWKKYTSIWQQSTIIKQAKIIDSDIFFYNCHSKKNVRKIISISTYNQKNVVHKIDSWHSRDIRRSVAHNYEKKIYVRIFFTNK
jgi:hypothetical protein